MIDNKLNHQKVPVIIGTEPPFISLQVGIDMKFEAVFGDQSLFDGAPDDAEAVGGGKPHHDAVVFYKFSNGEFQYKYKEEGEDWKVSTCKNPQSVIKAMRRIIAEPKRWTWADKDAGRSPVYGAILESNGGSRVKFLAENNRGLFHCQYDDGSICAYLPKFFKPIETPAEKAQRLEDEHLNMVAKHHPEFDIPTARAMYRMYLSGELEVPKEVDQS